MSETKQGCKTMIDTWLGTEDFVEDKQNKRLLYPNGISIVSEEDYMRLMNKSYINNDLDISKIKVFPSKDSSDYYTKFLDDISFNDDLLLLQKEDDVSTDFDIDKLYTLVINSPRFQDNNNFVNRIEYEMEYLIRSNNVKFFLRINELVNRFKEDNVVWGVGRGSSCACLVLYCLELHDVNPLEFDIPFKEFSKE